MNQQGAAFLMLLLPIIKIGITIWAGYRAKELNRNIVGWIIFTLFLTLPAFIILLCLNKKKDKSEKKIEQKPVISSVGEKVIDKIQSINLKVSKQHLIKKNWVLLKESEEERQIYIFQKDQTLLIANSGDVIKGKWEEVGDNLLMIEFDNKSTLYQPSYESESIFILKVNGKEQYLHFVDKNVHEREGSNIDMTNNHTENNSEHFHSSLTKAEQEENQDIEPPYGIFVFIILLLIGMVIMIVMMSSAC